MARGRRVPVIAAASARGSVSWQRSLRSTHGGSSPEEGSSWRGYSIGSPGWTSAGDADGVRAHARAKVAVLIGPGQGGDSPMFAPLLAAIRVPRSGPGRPRTRPDAVIADKTYSSRGHRAHLRRRGITAVILEPADQAAHRRKRGSAGARRVGYDRTAYQRRNVIERAYNQLKAWRGIATRYDKHATVFHRAVLLASILIRLRD
jgi:transposase